MEDFPSVTAGGNSTGGPAAGNSTGADPYHIEFAPAYAVLNTIYYAVLGPVAVLGNALSVAVSRRILRYRKSIPDMLTGTLAAVDLLCLLASHVPAIVCMAEGRWLGGIYLCSYQYFMAWSCLKTSFFIIILLTVDRFLALVKPFYYRANVTLGRMKLAAFGVTLFSFASTSVTVIWFADAISLLPNWYMCMNTWGKDNEYYSYILGFYGLTFVAGVVLFNVCNTGIVCSLMRHTKRADQMRLRVLSAAQDRRERRVAKVIETLSVLFMLFWVPYLVFIVLHQTNVFYSEVAEDLAIRILFANTILNPLIYGLFNRSYRKAYWYFLRRLLYTALCGRIKKPKERKIFYLRRSYLQHRYARRTRENQSAATGGSRTETTAGGLAASRPRTVVDANGNSLADAGPAGLMGSLDSLGLDGQGLTAVSRENLLAGELLEEDESPDGYAVYTLSGAVEMTGTDTDGAAGGGPGLVPDTRLAVGLENGVGPPRPRDVASDQTDDDGYESTWM